MASFRNLLEQTIDNDFIFEAEYVLEFFLLTYTFKKTDK